MGINWKAVDAVYFDLDNTLIDHSAAEQKAFEHCFDSSELHRGVYGKEALLRRYRVINEKLWAEYRVGHISTDELRLQRWAELMHEQFHQHSYVPTKSVEELSALYLQQYDRSSVLMEGAEELIETMCATFRFCGLITNGFPEQVRQKLENLKWTERFHAVVISEVVGVAKPNARIFELARDLSSASDSALLYIGDNFEVDMVGAKKVGWQTIWFDRHEAHLPLYRDYADERVSTLLELRRSVLQHTA